jgi:hypothetical protein
VRTERRPAAPGFQHRVMTTVAATPATAPSALVTVLLGLGSIGSE